VRWVISLVEINKLFELFVFLHFILTEIFCLTHFYVFFVNILKKVNFSDFKPSPTCDESSVWCKSTNSLNYLFCYISFWPTFFAWLILMCVLSIFWKKLISQIPNLHQRAVWRHGVYAMVPMNVLTRVTRKCAIVLRTYRSNVIVTGLMMVVQGGGDAYYNRIYAMATMTVLTRVTRKCAIVLRTIRSNVIVTSLMMVVQGSGDAWNNRKYVTATTTVVIGRMKSIV